MSAPWTYSDLDRRQRQIAEQVRKEFKEYHEEGALLLSEVAPVITLGRRTPVEDISNQISHSQFGIEICRTDRGGLATYHGPGQWVVFPVDRLDRLTGDSRGVRKAVEALLETALAVARYYEPKAQLGKGCELGVWTPRGKIASVGIHISQGVLLHGLAINGFRTQTSFLGLRPCGLDAPVDFLLSHPSENEFQLLGQRIIEEILKRFWRTPVSTTC